MLKADPHSLDEAIQLRIQNAPMRLVAVGATGLLFGTGLHWWWIGPWMAVYVASMMCERAAAGWRRRAPGPASTAVCLLAIFVSGSLYGGISLPLLMLDNAFGVVLATVVVAGGLMNALIVSRASRAMFITNAAPYSLCLLILTLFSPIDPELRLMLVISALLLQAYAVAAWLGLKRAIVAETVARRELEAKRLEAEAATEAKSAFVAMVSHELRNPLSGIATAGEVLMMTPADDSVHDPASLVVDASAYMQKLLDDLLDMAKIEAGRMTVEPVEFALADLVGSLRLHWSTVAAREGKPLRVVSGPLPRLVLGDPTRLRQVFQNLLSNAMKFTDAGGVTWTLDVVEQEDGWTLCSRVSDSGPGIPPEVIGRLFTRYEQADETIARTHGGTGLGLALSRELANLMGGELHVESEVGRGATFVVSVPLGRGEERRRPQVLAA